MLSCKSLKNILQSQFITISACFSDFITRCNQRSISYFLISTDVVSFIMPLNISSIFHLSNIFLKKIEKKLKKVRFSLKIAQNIAVCRLFFHFFAFYQSISYFSRFFIYPFFASFARAYCVYDLSNLILSIMIAIIT